MRNNANIPKSSLKIDISLYEKKDLFKISFDKATSAVKLTCDGQLSFT